MIFSKETVRHHKLCYPEHVLTSINYIHNNYAHELSLNLIAEEQNLNKCYLCQMFKEHTNSTVTEFINKIRLEKSKIFLKSTTDSIINVSISCGFNNVTYYNKLFKREFGITPLQYRKKYI